MFAIKRGRRLIMDITYRRVAVVVGVGVGVVVVDVYFAVLLRSEKFYSKGKHVF
jgi:hypothetical protein